MKLVLHGPLTEERLAFIQTRLEPGWAVRMWEREEGREVLAAEMADADAVVAMSWRAGSPPAPRLRLIQLPGAGLDRIDFAHVPEPCAVCNVFEHEIGIAEYVVLALLEWEIRLCRMAAALRRGEWADGFALDRPLHGELHGKTVGFIGYGRIARESARRLRPFGVRLVARTRSPDKGDALLDECAGMARLDEMLAAAHYVVVACPLDHDTHRLIDARRLAAMRPDAVLVNVARGPIVDEDALFAACRERSIAGAVIDTWYRYPKSAAEPFYPATRPFQDLDNVIMTPHASGWSAGLLDRRWGVICDNLNRLARGESLRNVVRAPGAPPPG